MVESAIVFLEGDRTHPLIPKSPIALDYSLPVRSPYSADGLTIALTFEEVRFSKGKASPTFSRGSIVGSLIGVSWKYAIALTFEEVRSA